MHILLTIIYNHPPVPSRSSGIFRIVAGPHWDIFVRPFMFLSRFFSDLLYRFSRCFTTCFPLHPLRIYLLTLLTYFIGILSHYLSILLICSEHPPPQLTHGTETQYQLSVSPSRGSLNHHPRPKGFIRSLVHRAWSQKEGLLP